MDLAYHEGWFPLYIQRAEPTNIQTPCMDSTPFVPPFDWLNEFPFPLKKILHCKSQGRVHPHQPSQHKWTVWRYMHANFEKASEMISGTDWDALAFDDIDQYCSLWQNTFLSIMNECIPKKVLHITSHGWTRDWYSLYVGETAISRRPRDPSPLCSSVSTNTLETGWLPSCGKPKKDYFCNLNTSNTKQFWKTIKVLNKQGASIGSLTHGDTTCMSNEDKADAFNVFFSSCFNSTCPPISTTTSTCDHGCSDSIVYWRRGLWATQVSRYNQSKWAWWYLCSYVEINSQCNCSITHKIIQLLHCMWPSSNQLENFLCGSHT